MPSVLRHPMNAKSPRRTKHLQARRVIAVGCFILAVPLLVVGLVLAFVSALDVGIHEVLPAHDYETILAFFLPGLALYFLGLYLQSRST
jgi:ABC-type dipeptide/oligopeptide/nickel transport system permease component